MIKISYDLICIDVNDKKTDLFEGQFVIPNGISYNSYIVSDKKTVVISTADERFSEEWIKEVKSALGDKIPDYLVILHMEPDHSASISDFLKIYPKTEIVGNSKIFVMLEEFFGAGFAKNRVEIKDGDELSLGRHVLKFIFAPMVHWPEVMVAYDMYDKTLYSADGFGKFGALDCKEDWDNEARRYYFGIVGKFGAQVQSLLKKLTPFELKRICPLHGPVLENDLGRYIRLYDRWSSYLPEKDGVMIAYTSIYGHTKQAALELVNKLKEYGVNDVVVYDLARADRYECIAQAFSYSTLVLATTTYNGTLFPAMREFLDCLTERNYRNRNVGFIENGSWAPVAAAAMAERLSKCKDLTLCKNTVKIRSALNEESVLQLGVLADELAKNVTGTK